MFINYGGLSYLTDTLFTKDVVASWNSALKGLKFLTQGVRLRGSPESPPTRCRSKKG